MRSLFDFQREKKWFLNNRPVGKFAMIMIGIVSTIWFFIRVIPKPDRATYPCMQAAAPFAAAFLTYISGLLLSSFAIIKLRSGKTKGSFSGIALVFVAACLGILLTLGGDNTLSRASANADINYGPPNSPMGIARGIFPGRVVWVWNPDATDETCTNTPGDYWFQDDNVDSEVIEDMLSKSLQLLSGEDSDSLAWDALFRSYNETHGNPNVGYEPGQIGRAHV